MVEKTNEEFIEFCKRIETAEDISNFINKKSQKDKSEIRNSKDPGYQVSTGRTKKGRKRKANSLYHCVYHGENTTHNTDQCKVMKQQAQAMAANHKGCGGKYKCVHNPDQEKKWQDKKSFLQDVVKRIVKRQCKNKPKSCSSRKNEEQYNLDFEQFRSLYVESSPEPSIINVDNKSHSTSSHSLSSQLHSSLAHSVHSVTESE